MQQVVFICVFRQTWQKVFYEQLEVAPAVSINRRFKKHHNSSFSLPQGMEMIIIKVSWGIIKPCPEHTEKSINSDSDIQDRNKFTASLRLWKNAIVNWGTGIEKHHWSMKTITFRQVSASHTHISDRIFTYFYLNHSTKIFRLTTNFNLLPLFCSAP